MGPHRWVDGLLVKSNKYWNCQ